MIENFSYLNKYNNKDGNCQVSKIISLCSYYYHNLGLGKPNTSKNDTIQNSAKMKRNSTGNLYEEILEQFKPDHNKYIRDLVNNN